MNDEFYLGYENRAPSGLTRHTRRFVAIVAAVTVVVMAVLAGTQIPADMGTYEFGITHPFEGVLVDHPLPLLQVTAPQGGRTNYVLVGSGKFGVPKFALGHNGQRVGFNGSLIRRGNVLMIEMNDEKSFRVIPDKSVSDSPRALISALSNAPSISLAGELVDTKCFLGVMRPGAGKVHRGCAARCLSGGVPPGLLVRDTAGNSVVFLLAGPGGKPLIFDFQWAARLVIAKGKLVYRDNLPVIEAETLALTD